MIHPQDREAMEELARRDEALPVLALLAEPDTLAHRLGAAVDVRRIRYKPGTSLQAAITVGANRDWFLLTGYGPSGTPKLIKDRSAARSRGLSVSADDPTRNIIVPAVADRALPQGAIDETGPLAQVISYNPRRRLIMRVATDVPPSAHGHTADVLVKVHHDPVGIDAALVSALRRSGVPTPAPLPSSQTCVQRRAWCVGRHPDPARDGSLVAAALEALHTASPPREVPRWSLGAHLQRACTALDHVGTVLPRARAAAVALSIGLRRTAATTSLANLGLLHGDLSADQVLIDRGTAWLIDLDACSYGPRGWDPASWLASQIAGGTRHPAMLPGPRPEPLMVALALALRSPEPFVRQRHTWVATTMRILRLALEQLEIGAPVAAVDA